MRFVVVVRSPLVAEALDGTLTPNPIPNPNSSPNPALALSPTPTPTPTLSPTLTPTLTRKALDGFMLPDAHGCTGVPWLTTEIHLTRAAPAPGAAPGTAAPLPSTAASMVASTAAPSSPPSPAACAHAASTPGPHAFRGGFRLASEVDGQGAAVLRAVSAHRTHARAAT